eukprot:2482829-Prymnesium_polylepis.1
MTLSKLRSGSPYFLRRTHRHIPHRWRCAPDTPNKAQARERANGHSHKKRSINAVETQSTAARARAASRRRSASGRACRVAT